MRTHYYSALCIQRLAELDVTEDEMSAIALQVRQLAKEPRLGYPIPFHHSSEPLWRYDVGRFGLDYTFDAKSLTVVAVVG